MEMGLPRQREVFPAARPTPTVGTAGKRVPSRLFASQRTGPINDRVAGYPDTTLRAGMLELPRARAAMAVRTHLGHPQVRLQRKEEPTGPARQRRKKWMGRMPRAVRVVARFQIVFPRSALIVTSPSSCDSHRLRNRVWLASKRKEFFGRDNRPAETRVVS